MIDDDYKHMHKKCNDGTKISIDMRYCKEREIAQKFTRHLRYKSTFMAKMHNIVMGGKR